MRLTRESEYALLGLAHLALESTGRSVPLAEIAEAGNLPGTFLAKIFQKLARHGVVVSGRGRDDSGYALSRAPGQLSIMEIFEAVEGPQIHERCLLWQGHCSDRDPCPLHYRLRDLAPAIGSLLETITLADYVAESPHFQRRKHVCSASAAGRGSDGRSERVPREGDSP